MSREEGFLDSIRKTPHFDLKIHVVNVFSNMAFIHLNQKTLYCNHIHQNLILNAHTLVKRNLPFPIYSIQSSLTPTRTSLRSYQILNFSHSVRTTRENKYQSVVLSQPLSSYHTFFSNGGSKRHIIIYFKYFYTQHMTQQLCLSE